MKPQLNPKRLQRADLSIGHILVLIIILSFLAAGAAGYLWYSLRSQKARVDRAEDEAIQAKRLVEIERQQNETERQRGEDRARRDGAKSKREAFAIRAGTLTNSIENLLVDIPALQAQLAKLRTGEEGKSVALHPDLVVSARAFFQREVADLPTRDEAVQKLESVRRVLFQLTDKTDTTFEPTPEMIATLDDTRPWVDTAARRVQTAKGIADSLLREGQIKVPPAPLTPQSPTLQAAIDAFTTKEWNDRLQIETDKLNQAQQRATAMVADAKTNELLSEVQREVARQLQAVEARKTIQDIELQKMQDAVNAEKLRAKAQSPEVKNALAAFTTAGNVGANGRFSVEQVPLSYSDLVAVGALQPTIDGLLKLQQIATNPNDKIRPRMPRGLMRRDKNTLETYTKAQKLLIELGPTMVELKMLAP